MGLAFPRSMKHIYLVTARKRRKLTQAELGRRIGKPQSFIAKLELGTKPDVTRDEAVALGRELDIDPLAIRFGPVPRSEAKAS